MALKLENASLHTLIDLRYQNFRLKKSPNGSKDKYTGRNVTEGFRQRRRTDYEKVQWQHLVPMFGLQLPKKY